MTVSSDMKMHMPNASQHRILIGPTVNELWGSRTHAAQYIQTIDLYHCTADQSMIMSSICYL